MRADSPRSSSTFGDVGIVVDLIAAIHELRFEVIEPERCRTALGHLEQVIRRSRESWTAIEAETDDDHERIPNAMQQAAIPGMRVGCGMIAGWRESITTASWPRARNRSAQTIHAAAQVAADRVGPGAGLRAITRNCLPKNRHAHGRRR